MRQLRDYVEQARAEILKIPGAGKVEILGTQDEVLYLNFSTRKLAALGIDQQAVLNSLQPQNAVTPAGVIQAGPERVRCGSAGSCRSEPGTVNLRVNDRFFRLADIANIRRGYVDPAQPMFRFNGQPAIGMAIGMKANGNILQFGKVCRRACRDRRTCRWASAYTSSPTSLRWWKRRSAASPRRCSKRW